MITLEQYNRLKTLHEKATAKKDKAKGAVEQLKSQVQKDFGCDSISEAKTKLKKLQHQNKKASESLSIALKEFEEKWGTKIA